VAIVVNKANPIDGLTLTQLRRILLGQEPKWPTGKKIAVMMTTPGQPERDAALKIVCNMRETDFTLYFMHASFNGESGDLPKNGGSGLQVRQLVAGNPNAIGIIKASQADASVKVLPVDGRTPGQSAYQLTIK
jgi:ABC-type phosphate transport system substrate-binding protein